ncbi:SPRY domain-containing protein [Pseudolabrys sp.]|uniref:SPRY domain-containing protein n=1 Tax=Pseudolabrys sp. TaxID=1960880 RepID=UPI003D0D3708
MPLVSTFGSASARALRSVLSWLRISRSLRFDGTAYLNWTPSAGNRKTYTISMWVKRAGFGTSQVLFYAGTNSDNKTRLIFSSAGTLQFYDITGGSTERAKVYSNAVYLDPRAHMHVLAAVDTTQATPSDRIKLYARGVQITSLGTASYPSQNSDLYIGGANDHRIGAGPTGDTLFYDGLISEVNYIDGLALDPSYFGRTDPATGEWVAKKYRGSYGANGRYFDFSDNSNTTSSTLGKDRSGNGGDATPNNFTVSDSSLDVPSRYGDDPAARGNYCTLNPLDMGANLTLSEANLKVVGTSNAAYSVVLGTIGVSSGKWYWEVTVGSSAAANAVGIAKALINKATYLGNDPYGYGYFATGDYYAASSGSLTASYASFTTNDVVGVALDLDSGTLQFYLNGSAQGSPTTSLSGVFFPAGCDGSSGSVPNLTFNFGQRAFTHTPPTGFKALCTRNLTDTTVAAPATFNGNASASGPSVWANGEITAITINGNVAVEGTHFRRTAGGLQIITSSSSYNASGSNTITAYTPGTPFKYARAA